MWLFSWQKKEQPDDEQSISNDSVEVMVEPPVSHYSWPNEPSTDDRHANKQHPNSINQNVDQSTSIQLDRQLDRQSDQQSNQQLDRQSDQQSDQQLDQQSNQQLDQQSNQQLDQQSNQQSDQELYPQSDQLSNQQSNQKSNQQSVHLTNSQSSNNLLNNQTSSDQPDSHSPDDEQINNETTYLFNNSQTKGSSNSNLDQTDAEREDAEPDDERTDADSSHKSVLKELVKQFLISSIVLLTVYVLGWFKFSFAWILIGLVIYFVCSANRIRAKRRLLANRELADEKKYIERVLVDLPNWVLFPDAERVEFLNKCLKQLWPFLNSYIQRFLKDTLLPEIIAHLPSYMKGMRFETIDLGTIPLRIGSIKCHTERSSRMEILLDLQIIYAGIFCCCSLINPNSLNFECFDSSFFLINYKLILTQVTPISN